MPSLTLDHHHPLWLSLAVAFALMPTIAAAAAKDWNSPQELGVELQVYQGMVYALLGLQFWEHMLTFEFELAIFTGRAKWRHGMLAYLIIRYSTWASLIPMMININSKSYIHCEASLIALLIPFSFATMTTSLMFVIRCIAVWEKNGYVVCILLPLWATEACLHLSSPARIHSSWTGNACETHFTKPMWEYNLAYLFVEIVDIITFFLTAWRLRTIKNVGIGKILFQQSVAYVLVATILNTVCLALFYLALNPLMGYICSPMAMTLSGILACRAFRDLQRSASRPERSLDTPHLTSTTWPPSPPEDPESGIIEREPKVTVQTSAKHDRTSSRDAITSRGGHGARHSVSGRHETSRRRSVAPQTLAERGRKLGQRVKEDWIIKSGLGENFTDEPPSIFSVHRPHSPSFLNMKDTVKSNGTNNSEARRGDADSDTEPLRNDDYVAAQDLELPTTLPLALKAPRSPVSTSHTVQTAGVAKSFSSSNSIQGFSHGNSSSVPTSKTSATSHRLKDIESGRLPRDNGSTDDEVRHSHEAALTASTIEGSHLDPDATVRPLATLQQYQPPEGQPALRTPTSTSGYASSGEHYPTSASSSRSTTQRGRARGGSLGDGGIHDYLSHASQFLVPPRNGGSSAAQPQQNQQQAQHRQQQQQGQQGGNQAKREGQAQGGAQQHQHQQHPRPGGVPYGQTINQGVLLYSRY